MAFNKTKVERVVVKLSGSLFRFDLKAEVLRPFCTLFIQQVKRGLQPILITGGGEIARFYISLARGFGFDESSLDEMGIDTSRLNAQLLISALGEICHPLVPKNLGEIVEAAQKNGIVVSGGLHPGHSTNATAALIAERLRAKMFINATDVDGVYTGDPRRLKTARKLESIDTRSFTKLLSEGKMTAGTYELMDLVALKVIERSRIPTVIVKCTAKNIQAAAEGKQVGTLIITR